MGASKGRDQVITVKWTKEQADLIFEIANRQGKSISSFIRTAVLKEIGRLGYLPQEQMKALEITGGSP